MTKILWAPTITMFAMICVLAYHYDKMKVTQDSLVVLATDKGNKHELDLSMGFQASYDGHMDGFRVSWTGMSLEEFIERYPDSHFIHMQFKDMVLTIDWSHAKWSGTNEYLQNLLETMEAEKPPFEVGDIVTFDGVPYVATEVGKEAQNEQ